MKQSEIERLLPGVIQRTVRPGNPLDTLLKIMEALHAPTETILTGIDAVFDPRRTPDRFVPFLARWLDLDSLLDEPAPASGLSVVPAEPISTGTGRLRELIAAASYLSHWRGTGKGLLRFLEIATGETGFAIEESVVEDSGRIRPFHIRVHAPDAVSIHRLLLERIIEMEKPAYVTYQLQFDPPHSGDN